MSGDHNLSMLFLTQLKIEVNKKQGFRMNNISILWILKEERYRLCKSS